MHKLFFIFLFLVGELFSANPVLECVAYEVLDTKTGEPIPPSKNMLKRPKIKLTVYKNKLNDGTYDYYYTNQEKHGSIMISYYKNTANKFDAILLSKQYTDGVGSYPLRFVMGNLIVDTACFDKK